MFEKEFRIASGAMAIGLTIFFQSGLHVSIPFTIFASIALTISITTFVKIIVKALQK